VSNVTKVAILFPINLFPNTLFKDLSIHHIITASDEEICVAFEKTPTLVFLISNCRNS